MTAPAAEHPLRRLAAHPGLTAALLPLVLLLGFLLLEPPPQMPDLGALSVDPTVARAQMQNAVLEFQLSAPGPLAAQLREAIRLLNLASQAGYEDVRVVDTDARLLLRSNAEGLELLP